jgi:hypothetical protein
LVQVDVGVALDTIATSKCPGRGEPNRVTAGEARELRTLRAGSGTGQTPLVEVEGVRSNDSGVVLTAVLLRIVGGRGCGSGGGGLGSDSGHRLGGSGGSLSGGTSLGGGCRARRTLRVIYGLDE